MSGSLARQPCPSALPVSLARQPFLAALPASRAGQKYYNLKTGSRPAELQVFLKTAVAYAGMHYCIFISPMHEHIFFGSSRHTPQL
jgi:hypothetical protein